MQNAHDMISICPYLGTVYSGNIEDLVDAHSALNQKTRFQFISFKCKTTQRCVSNEQNATACVAVPMRNISRRSIVSCPS